MSEGASEGQGGGGTGAQGGGGAGEGGAGGGASPEWLATLPADLQADATLGRYASVEALARGHVEAHKVAKSKLTVPAADAPAEQWGAVFDQLGRPADPKDYDIPLPEGLQDTGMADAFRPIAHQLGLLPGQAKGVVEFYNSITAGLDAQGAEQLTALKAEMGDSYAPQIELAKSAVEKMGLPDEFLNAAEAKFGTAELIKGFMKIGGLIGEAQRHDGEGGALGANLANAEKQLAELNKDASWRQKLLAGDATVKAQYDRLKAAAIAQAR